MEIRVAGDIKGIENVESILLEIVDKFLIKLGEDSPELQDRLTSSLHAITVTDLSATIGFEFDGQEEIMHITSDPNETGDQEMLVFDAKVDSDGNLDWDSAKTNEVESHFTSIEKLIAQGIPTEFNAVESVYYSDQLDEVEAILLADYEVVVFELITADHSAVVQYIKDNKLIAEIEIELEADQTIQDIVSHFKQLQ